MIPKCARSVLPFHLHWQNVKKAKRGGGGGKRAITTNEQTIPKELMCPPAMQASQGPEGCEGGEAMHQNSPLLSLLFTLFVL